MSWPLRVVIASRKNTCLDEEPRNKGEALTLSLGERVLRPFLLATLFPLQKLPSHISPSSIHPVEGTVALRVHLIDILTQTL